MTRIAKLEPKAWDALLHHRVLFFRSHSQKHSLSLPFPGFAQRLKETLEKQQPFIYNPTSACADVSQVWLLSASQRGDVNPTKRGIGDVPTVCNFLHPSKTRLTNTCSSVPSEVQRLLWRGVQHGWDVGREMIGHLNNPVLCSHHGQKK